MFPNFTPHPRHIAVTPIIYLETIIKHFFQIENACGYALDSGMCSKFDVELNVLQWNCTLICDLTVQATLEGKN